MRSIRGRRGAWAIPPGLATVLIIVFVFVLLFVLFLEPAFTLAALFVLGGILAVVFAPPKVGVWVMLAAFVLAAILYISTSAQQLSLALVHLA